MWENPTWLGGVFKELEVFFCFAGVFVEKLKISDVYKSNNDWMWECRGQFFLSNRLKSPLCCSYVRSQWPLTSKIQPNRPQHKLQFWSWFLRCFKITLTLTFDFHKSNSSNPNSTSVALFWVCFMFSSVAVTLTFDLQNLKHPPHEFLPSEADTSGSKVIRIHVPLLWNKCCTSSFICSVSEIPSEIFPEPPRLFFLSNTL